MEIRKLDAQDISLVENMDTGIENDYVLRVFPRLTEGNNHLFGLFYEGNLAIIGGFTLYKNRYAMLGRLRSDRRYRGQNLATKLNEFLIKKAFQLEGIDWVGANTKEDNTPAKRILEKLGLRKQTMLHGAVTENLEPLLSKHQPWQEVHLLSRKEELVQHHLIKNQIIFPYECYYPFPSSDELFGVDELDSWRFFENDQKTRFFILKTDQKKHVYCHIVYPWNDLHKQEGLWESVEIEYNKLKSKSEEDVHVWIDLTKGEVENLPIDHPFTVPTAWVLYGMNRKEYSNS